MQNSIGEIVGILPAKRNPARIPRPWLLLKTWLGVQASTQFLIHLTALICYHQKLIDPCTRILPHHYLSPRPEGGASRYRRWQAHFSLLPQRKKCLASGHKVCLDESQLVPSARKEEHRRVCTFIYLRTSRNQVHPSSTSGYSGRKESTVVVYCSRLF